MFGAANVDEKGKRVGSEGLRGGEERGEGEGEGTGRDMLVGARATTPGP